MKRILPILPALGIILLSGIIAIQLNFQQEDAFISYRYAKNFAEGYGFVYNPGEAPVEGYTNALWTYILGISALFTHNIPFISITLNLVCWLLALWVSRGLFNGILGRKWGLAALAMMAFHPFLVPDILNGMETALNVLLWASALNVAARITQPQKVRSSDLVWLGVMATLAILNRLDNVLFVGSIYVFIFIHLKTHKQLTTKNLLPFISIPILILGSWAIWKLSFYGEVLPNTFYAKAVSGSLRNGVFYILAFFLFSGYWAFEIPVVFFYRKFAHKITRWELFAIALIAIWWTYLGLVGGDYMGFRMMAPLFPAMLLAGLGRLSRMKIPDFLKYGMPALYMAGNLLFFLDGGKHIPTGFIQVRQPGNIYLKGNPWRIDDAKEIKAALGDDSTIYMATGAAGILPYFTGFRTLDMSGLNDRQIARTISGWESSDIPGHDHFADYQVLMQRGVNIVIGNWKVEPGSKAEDFKVSDEIFQKTLPGYSGRAPVSLLVVGDPSGWTKMVIYLNHHPTIDSVLEESIDNQEISLRYLKTFGGPDYFFENLLDSFPDSSISLQSN